MTQTKRSLSQLMPVGPPNMGPVERGVTGVLGAALAVGGWRRGGVGGSLMAFLGSVLALRAATGHCPAYQALGIGRPGETGAMDAPAVPPAGEGRSHRAFAEVLAGAEGPPRAVRRDQPADDLVEMESEMSFPASDPPSFTPEQSMGGSARS